MNFTRPCLLWIYLHAAGKGRDDLHPGARQASPRTFPRGRRGCGVNPDRMRSPRAGVPARHDAADMTAHSRCSSTHAPKRITRGRLSVRRLRRNNPEQVLNEIDRPGLFPFYSPARHRKAGPALERIMFTQDLPERRPTHRFSAEQPLVDADYGIPTTRADHAETEIRRHRDTSAPVRKQGPPRSLRLYPWSSPWPDAFNP